MNAPDLTLYSFGLLSKWGFSDGDCPDEIEDYLDEIDAPYPAPKDWHTALRKLVREHLLPALAEHHTIEVYDIDTIHNPIRARTVDGHEIDDYADNDHIVLAPDVVTVPWIAVAAALGVES